MLEDIVGILLLANRLGLGAGICIGNFISSIPNEDKNLCQMGTKPFMYSMYIALKMSLEKTIET
jgi:hypothetical protein